MTAQDVFLNMVDIFSKILPSRDGRTSAVPLKFVTAFIFSLCGDSRTRSLEGLRREMMGYLMVSLSSSSFWERLSRKRLLVFLRQILAEVMIQVTVSVQGSDILKLLKVTAILIVDSTSIELPEWAAKFFPGTGSAAAVKWHTCLDVMRGNLRWNRITPGRLHDRNCFPDMADLIGRLVIFDLGYWDYSLLQAIDQVGGFYLSRLRSDAVLVVREVVRGLGKSAVNKRLVKSLSRSGHASIIEAYCEHIDKETRLRLRVLGFWNPVGKCYHWYVTNLKVAGSLIYPLYRLRWQIELMFKGCKQSFKLDDINSGNKNIIESLLLGSLVAQICAQTILRNSLSRLNEDRQFAVSYQRINKVFVHLAPQIISFIVNKHEDSPVRLAATIDIFVWELFDPNYHHRRSSIAQIQDALSI